MSVASLVRAVRRLPRLETLVLVLAFGLLVTVAVATKHAKSTALLDSYSTYDAANGGYRALYELLAREGVRAGRFEQRPAFLTAQTDTLVWAEPLEFDPRQIATTKADVAALQEWVRAGGSLFYIGFDDVAAKRGILGLPRTRIAAAHRASPFITAPLARAGVARIDVRAARRYRVERHGMRVLLDDGRGAVVVTYAFGRGRVTALIDETLFTNAALARGDGARLAVALATPRSPRGSVDFDEAVHGHDVPERWWQIVPLPFALALAVAGATVLAAFAGAALRLGPPLLPETNENRTTGDFIDALGSLFARGKAIRYVLAGAERSTAHAVARALRLPEGATADVIATRIDDVELRADFRELARLANNGFADEKKLVRGVALAQRLRKEYSTHARPRY